MKKWASLFLMSIVFLSCEDDNTCGISERSSELFPSFFDYESKVERVVDFDSVGVKFAGEDVFYSDTLAAFLPIDLSGSFTDFIFHTDSIDYDFRLTYRTEILIENEDCDPVFRVFAIDASSESLDSIAVQVVELTTLISPHVEIYF